MAVYGPGCHPQNSIWTEARLRSIYYCVGDKPKQMKSLQNGHALVLNAL